MRRAVSSVVGETSTSFSSQSPKPKAGASGQSSNDHGFSDMVDSSLAAAADDDTGPAPAKPKASAGSNASQQPGKPATGVYKQKAGESDQATPPADKTAQPAEDTTVEVTINAAIETVVKTGVIAKTTNAEPAETPPETTEPEPAATANASAATTVTGIIPAVAVQIGLAVETPPESVIDSGDAIPVTNPPPTIVTPAVTAANALAKVAADTGDAEVEVKAETTADAELPPATETEVKAPTVEVETATLVEAAAPEALLDAKAKAELASAAKSIDPKAVETPQPEAKSEPAKLDLDTPKAAAAPQEPVAKAEAPAKPAAEAKKDQAAAPDKPAEAEARPSPRPAREPATHAAAHAHGANTDQPQPNGVGLTQVAALHVPNVALNSAAFAAVAAATSMPVPISGLAVEIAANMQIGRSRFEIRLDPPELGRIDVRLDVDKQGQVTSHLIVEKSATLDLLRRDAQQLERALQDAGLKTSDNGLQFSLRDQQSGRNNDDGLQRNAHRLIVTEEETVAVETAGRSYGRMIGQRGGIDIRV
jgi:flagellar hook-length control protein FliK